MPWVDTMDLDVAARRLYDRTDGTQMHWPPGTDAAYIQLHVQLIRSVDGDALDDASNFSRPGFPHPLRTPLPTPR